VLELIHEGQGSRPDLVVHKDWGQGSCCYARDLENKQLHWGHQDVHLEVHEDKDKEDQSRSWALESY